MAYVTNVTSHFPREQIGLLITHITVTICQRRCNEQCYSAFNELQYFFMHYYLKALL